MATCADLAGVETPENTDSISFLATITGQPQQQQKSHDYLYWEFYEQGGKQAVRAGHWKAIRRPWMTGKTQLYDLSRDISETDDVARQHPERVARMEAVMAEAHRPHPNWRPR
jgi:uncharacterized sulfatase